MASAPNQAAVVSCMEKTPLHRDGARSVLARKEDGVLVRKATVLNDEAVRDEPDFEIGRAHV